MTLQEPIMITEEGLVQPQNAANFAANKHNISHTEKDADRPFQCDICDRAFKKSSHLKQHIRSHTGEKPFKCIQCQRSFVSNGALKAHLKTHLGVKNYKCKVCCTLFSTNGSLKRHMSTHSSARPYMCPYCQKTFKTSLDCKKHMKIHKPKLLFVNAPGEGSLDDLCVLPDQHSILKVDDHEEIIDGPEEIIEHIEVEEDDGQEAVTEHKTNTNQMDDEAVILATGYEQREIIISNNLQDLNNQVYQVHDNLNPVSMEQSTEIVPFDQAQLLSHYTENFTLQADGMDLVSASMESILSMPETPKKNQSETTDNYVNVLDAIELVQVDPKTDQENAMNNKKRIFKCDICGKTFKRSNHLKQHALVHTGEKPYSCNYCQRSFSSSGVLRTHLKTHTGVKDYKCYLCDAAFTTNGSLVRHMQVHTDSNLFSCDTCGDSFRTKHLYLQHSKIHKEVPAKVQTARKRPAVLQLSAEQADRLAKVTLPDSASVSEQILIASASEKNRISEIISKAAALENCPKFAHQCSLCPKSFKKPSDLVRHVRTHTGEKPFPCNLCSKSFTVKSTLDCHLKTHSGQKNFLCHVCSTPFATKGSLKVHMRLHTGAKPFKCPHCGLRFRTSGHRKSHISTHFRNNSARNTARKTTQIEHVPEQVPTIEENIEISDPDPTLSNITLTAESLNSLLAMAANATGGELTAGQGIQLQIPQSLLGQNIQITGIDPALLSQTMQIDGKFLQQLQQHGNINITITPNIQEVSRAQVEVQGMVQTIEDQVVEVTNENLMTVNPNIIIEKLGMTINEQGHLVSDGIEVVNFDYDRDKEDIDLEGCVNIGQGITISDNGDIIQNMLNTSHICSACGACFQHEDHLAEHLIREHNGPDAMQRAAEAMAVISTANSCPVCFKSFKKPSQLNKHQLIHTSDKPFKCKTCDKSFIQKISLDQHELKHTDKKVFKCDICDHTFQQKGNLKTHLKRVHKEGT